MHIPNSSSREPLTGQKRPHSPKVDLPTNRRRKHNRQRKSRRDNRKSRYDADYTADDERHNEALTAYYRAQKIVSPDEFDLLMACLATPLPTSFRITANGSFRDDIMTKLKGEMFDLFSRVGKAKTEAEGGDENAVIRPPTQLPWYPAGLAWTVSAPRQMLRRNNVLSPFHKFLVRMNDLGAINRQEAVSMIPPLMLQPGPGHSVLDMCAAPGSKTAQILNMASPPGRSLSETGVVIANDADIRRCWMLAHQLKRFSSADLVVTNHEAQYFPKFMMFDRVLCDVPCTGDGTLRKAPDIWRRWTPDAGIGIHRLQRQILERGIDLLKPGGRLVYSTCSMNPLENEAVVAHALRKYKGDVELLECGSVLPELKRRPGLMTWLVRDNSEKLSKEGDADDVGNDASKERNQEGANTTEPFPASESENIVVAEQGEAIHSVVKSSNEGDAVAKSEEGTVDMKKEEGDLQILSKQENENICNEPADVVMVTEENAKRRNKSGEVCSMLEPSIKPQEDLLKEDGCMKDKESIKESRESGQKKKEEEIPIEQRGEKKEEDDDMKDEGRAKESGQNRAMVEVVIEQQEVTKEEEDDGMKDKESAEKSDGSENRVMREVALEEKEGTKKEEDSCMKDDGGVGWFTSFDDVPLRRRKKIVQSLFPPTEDEVASGDFPLQRCMRLVPHDQDTGGFFVSVLVKKDTARLSRKQRRDLETESGQEDKKSDDEGKEKEGIENGASKGGMAVRKNVPKYTGRGGTRLITDDPFVSLNSLCPETLDNMSSFFGLDKDVMEQCLMTRSSDGKKFKRVMAVSCTVRNIIRHSLGTPDTDFDIEKRILRVVNAGVRVLERTDRKDTCCGFRLVSEGARLMRGAMRKRTGDVRDHEIERLIKEEKIDIKEGGVWAELVKMGGGSVLLRGRGEEVIAWVGKQCVSVVMPRDILRALRVRFGQTEEDLTKEDAIKKEESIKVERTEIE